MRFTAFSVLSVAVLLLTASFRGPQTYVVGDRVSNFRLLSTDGNYVSLDDFPQANGFFIIFTCNHCPYSQLYEQRIIDLHRKYAPKGYPVIAINPNDPEIVPDDGYEEMKKRARQKRYPFPYLFDEQQQVYPIFGANRTPHVFLLDRTRVVRYIGAIDDNAEVPAAVSTRYAEDAVEALIRGERPAVEFTRAVGCRIKAKK